MQSAIRIGLVRTFLIPAAMVLGLLVVTAEAHGAQPTTSIGWVGRSVVPKARKLALKDPKNGSDHSGAAAIYQVTQANGKSLLLSPAPTIETEGLFLDVFHQDRAGAWRALGGQQHAFNDRC